MKYESELILETLAGQVTIPAGEILTGPGKAEITTTTGDVWVLDHSISKWRLSFSVGNTITNATTIPVSVLKEKKGPPFMQKDPIELLKKDLARVGYVTSDELLLAETHLLRQQTERPLEGCSALILDGPPGTGKTYLAKCFAKLWGAEFHSLQFTRGIGIERLMFDLNIPAIIHANATSDVKFSRSDALNPGVLWKVLIRSRSQRVVLLLDEMDKAQETVDAFLLQFLNDCAIDDPSDPGLIIRGGARNLIVFITKNNERQLSEPLMRRCRTYYMAWPDVATETKLVSQLARRELRGQTIRGDLDGLVAKLVGAANSLRKMQEKLLKVPSTPELAHAAADAMLLPPQYRGMVIHNWLLRYQSDMKEVYSEHNAFQPGNLTQTFRSY